MKQYIKSVYEGSLENIFSMMIEIYIEKNSKETDKLIYENNLLNFALIIVALPISNSSKLSVLNSLNFDSEKVSIFENGLENILSHEEALDQLISILYMEQNFEDSVKKISKLLE